MFGSLLCRVAQTLIQIALGISILLSAQARAQSTGTTAATSMPYTIAVQDVSGNCTLDGNSFSGVLTPTGQANTYTTIFVGGTVITLTVPGSNALVFSYLEGNGTTTENMQLTFDSQSRSITGSTNWTHTNGCMGYETISGSWTDSASPIAPSQTSITPTTPLPPPPATQAVFTVPTGKMPTAAVSVSPSGTFGDATLVITLDLSKVLSESSFAGLGQFAAGYNIYVVALVPSGALGLSSAAWFMYPATRAWAALGAPIAAFMEGLAQDATNSVAIPILRGMDVTSLLGTEIYIGYGTSDTEMLSAGRYRGVYKVR